MLASISVGFVPPLPLSLGALYSLVNMSLASLPSSLLLFESRLVCLCSLSLLWVVMTISAPRAGDDGGHPHRFDGSCPPCGRGRNVFPPCPHCGKHNDLANKWWKHFGKSPTAQAVLTPPAPFFLAPPSILAPQYHVTLMSIEYDFTIRVDNQWRPSSSPSWIVDSGASSHMTETSSLLLSYCPTPSHPLSYHCRWSTLSGPRPWYYSCHPFSFSSPNPLCYWFPCKPSLY